MADTLLGKTMKELIVIGGGGHAKAVISALKKLKAFEIIGYMDVKDKGDVLGVRYAGSDEDLKAIKQKYPGCLAVIGIGCVTISDKRKRIKAQLEQLGFELPAIVSLEATVNEDVYIGKGTVVMDGAILNPGTRIGECVIVNTNSCIDHDCRIGDFVHIAPGATLSGGVTVGDNSIISAGATVIHGIKICANCIIGAGATVTQDCLISGTYVGVPARKI